MFLALWTALFVLAAIALALAAREWTAYVRWRRATLARLRDCASVIATAQGPMECAMSGEESPALLISHGILGGYDQGLAAIASGFFGQQRYKFIAVSRPGYLRTPASVGRTPEEQADAFAALLDALEIRRAIVVGLSAGGPAALQFALRHPERCAALLLVSAATGRIAGDRRAEPLLRAAMRTDFAVWALLRLARKYPRWILGAILSREEMSRIEEPKVCASVLRLLESFAPLSARRAGVKLDADCLKALEAYPLDAIRVPTLAVHGTSDEIVPFPSIERTIEAIPGAQLVALAGGSHFAGLQVSAEVSAEVNAFLEAAVMANAPELRSR